MSIKKLVVKEYLTTAVLDYFSLIHMLSACRAFPRQAIVATVSQLFALSRHQKINYASFENSFSREKFIKLLEKFMPDWNKRKEQLERVII